MREREVFSRVSTGNRSSEMTMSYPQTQILHQNTSSNNSSNNSSNSSNNSSNNNSKDTFLYWVIIQKASQTPMA